MPEKTLPLPFLSTLLAIQPARATGATNAAALQGVKDAKQTGQLKNDDNIYDPERKKPFQMHDSTRYTWNQLNRGQRGKNVEEYFNPFSKKNYINYIK